MMLSFAALTAPLLVSLLIAFKSATDFALLSFIALGLGTTFTYLIFFNPFQSQTNATKTEARDFGLDVLYAGDDPVVDIIVIHGLDGHREESWTAANGTNWLRDLLPPRTPRARILTYGYDAYTRSRQQLSGQSIQQHGESLLSDLVSERRECPRRPIIFIAHSLGGLVLKSALVIANGAHSGHNFVHKAIEISTYGVLFLGTPHQGTDAAEYAKIILGIWNSVSATNSRVVRDLAAHSASLQDLQTRYLPISGRYHTKFFYEEYETPLMGNRSSMLVPRHSAVIPTIDTEVIKLHKNHGGISKYDTPDDRDYKLIATRIESMLDLAPGVISKRWEKHDRLLQLDEEAAHPAFDAKSNVLSLEMQNLLDALPCVEGASWDSSPSKTCLNGTRTELLDGISSWIESRSSFSSRLFLLQGVLGSGKTTVAHTICKTCHDKGLLAAAFFFDRASCDRNQPAKIFSTIARSLADFDPKFAAAICSAIQADRSLISAPLARQFQSLIDGPANACRGLRNMAVVIDALDEGANDELIRVLCQFGPCLPSHLRFFLTSRPEHFVEKLSQEPFISASLDILSQSNLSDIEHYIDEQLGSIAAMPGMPTAWPDAELRRKFIIQAGGLFVWASTICQYIYTAADPDRLLRRLLDDGGR